MGWPTSCWEVGRRHRIGAPAPANGRFYAHVSRLTGTWIVYLPPIATSWPSSIVPMRAEGATVSPPTSRGYHEMSREMFGLSFGLLTGSIGKVGQ
jgi:hypothetical protein